jgi:succinate dehydrogenase / fumarate reductase membrane anchor subunit
MSTSQESLYKVAVRGAPRRGGGFERPTSARSNFELYSWLFMRVSGVILIFLALYHLVWWNLVVGVHHLDADLVRERWTNPFNRLYNVALCVFSIAHGLNGLRYSIEDYIRKPGRQVAAKAFAYTLFISVMAWGVFALLTFDPLIQSASR